MKIESVAQHARPPPLQADPRGQRLVADSPLSKREIIRRPGTSPAQFDRLLDQTDYRKSVDEMLASPYVLQCDLEFTIRAARAADDGSREAG